MPIMLLVVMLAALFLVAPSASAQRCEGRPGASAIQQYCEAIPEADGVSRRPGSGRTGAGSDGSGDTPSPVQSQLEDAGQDGRAVLGLIASGDDYSGPGADPDGGGSGTGSAGGRTSSEAKRAEGGVLDAVSASVSNGSTVGNAFAGILVGMAVLGAAFGWISLRRRHAP